MYWLYQSRWWDLMARSCAALAVLVYLMLVYFVQSAMIGHVRHTFRYTVAFAIVQAATLITGITGLALSKLVRERRLQVDAERIQHIEHLLTDYAIGKTSSGGELLECFARLPLEFTQVLGAGLHAVQGRTLERLQQLATSKPVMKEVVRRVKSRNPREVSAGMKVLARLPGSFSEQRLLELSSDPRNSVRLQAKRLIMRYGNKASQLPILSGLSIVPSWERIQLFQQLSPKSEVIPHYLSRSWQSNDPVELIAALELVLSMQRCFEVPNPSELATHPNLEVRIRYFRALRFLSTAANELSLVRTGLQDEDWRVRSMAARAAGQLRLTQLAADLAKLCSSSSHGTEVAHAARALASCGGPSWEQLRQMVSQGGIQGRHIAEVIQRSSLGTVVGRAR